MEDLCGGLRLEILFNDFLDFLSLNSGWVGWVMLRGVDGARFESFCVDYPDFVSLGFFESRFF